MIDCRLSSVRRNFDVTQVGMRSGDPYVPDKEALAVQLELGDGTMLSGRLWVQPGKSIDDALNAPHAFVEFLPYGHERPKYLAKSHIVALAPIDMPKLAPLHDRRGASSLDDPYQILAVAPGSSWLAVRSSYLELAKIYHPDRFFGMDLPAEIVDYLTAKTRRINAAYAVLEAQLKRTAKGNAKDTSGARQEAAQA